MRLLNRATRAGGLCAFLFMASVSCGEAQVKSDPSAAWVRLLVDAHFSGTELEKLNSRDAKAIAAAMVAWEGKVKPRFPAAVEAMELFMFVPRYDPIWLPTGSLNREAVAQRLARVEHLNKDVLGTWQKALAKLHGDSLSDLWTLAIMINIPRLYAATGLVVKEQEKLLARLEQLPQPAVDTLAGLANTAKARAAANLCQQDWLFAANGFDSAKFALAADALRKALPASGKD